MKKWISTVMLLSLLGSFASPVIGVAVDTTEGTTSVPTSEGSTISSISNDPQSSISTDSTLIPEKTESTDKSIENTNTLSFDKVSEFIDKDISKDQYSMNLAGVITSSAENDQPVRFEMTKSFIPEDNKEEKVILNEQKAPIGKYTVDATGTRTEYTLNFNKLSKGENHFRLILLGTIARGPDKTTDFYQNDKKIFQLSLPDEKESSDNTNESTVKSESEKDSSSETSESDASQEMTTEEKQSTKDRSKESVKKATTVKEQAKAAEVPRAAGSIDDLFAQFAPGDNFVTNSNLNFTPNPPTIHSTVDFHLDFEIPEAVRTEMVPGDYYEMDFPHGLSITPPSPHGNLTDSDGLIYGTYVFDAATQKLRITFTKQEGEEFLPPENGSVTADVHFDTQVITQPGKTTIVYPSKTNIPPATITIKPTVGTSISKAGHTDTPNNPSKVTWTVDFNKDFSELTNPSITEQFPDQVTFNQADTGAVTIYPLNVDFNGNVTGIGQTPVDPNTYTVGNDGSIQFKTKLDRPYHIVYSTTIKDSAKPVNGGQVTATNNVNLKADSTDLNASASVTLNYKKALEKAQTGYDRIGQVYSWQIRYNYGQKELADDTIISDTYTNMDIVPDSFNVYTVTFDSKGNPVRGTPIAPADYTIDTTTNPFTITFKNNVQAGKAINIDYKTKVNKIVSGSASDPVVVSNQAKTDNLPPTTSNHYTPSQQVVIKNKPTIDVGTKTARYLIDINKNKYEMDNALFTDTMGHSQEGYISVPVKVKSPNGNDDAGVIIRDVSDRNKILTGAFQLLGTNGEDIGTIGDVATADYVVTVNVTADRKGYTNFTVKFQNGYKQTNHQFQMEYYIAYNQFRDDVPNPNTSVDYQNTMKANFTNNGKPYDSSSSTDFKTSTQEVNQGMKSGSYNPATKEITWTIVTNYNDLGMSAFHFRDPITGNQVYEPDSLTLTRGMINQSGNFQPTTDSNYSGNQKDKSYVKITDPQPTGESEQGTLEMQIGDNGNYIPGWDVTGTPMVFRIQFKTSLKDKIVYNQSTYANTAFVKIDGVEQQLPASVSIAFGGQSAVKDGKYNTQTGLINWSLDINPNQSLLSNVKIQDTPSSNQILQESFKLYTGKYEGSGSATTVQPDQLVPVDQYKVVVTTDPETGQQSFTVDMSGIKEKSDPNNAGGYLTGVIEKPYVLTYDTEPNFTSKTESVTNNASISSEGKELPGKDTQKNITVTIQDSSGTAYGSKGKINIQKVDKNSSIVKGAVLQLLRKNTKTNKTDILYQATTDSQGRVTFGNLIATSSTYEYYVKEISAPDGYTISPDLLNGKKVSVSTSSDAPITQIENEPIKVLFNKENSAGQNIAGGLFNLFINSGTRDVPNYTILKLLEPTNQGVDLSGLGDGQYRIQEVIAPDGYQINQTFINFEIKKNADNSRSVFVNDQPVSNGVLEMKDYQGSAVLKKTDESGKNLAGAKFNLQRANINSNDYSDFGDQSTYVTNNNGQLNLKNLAPGKYKLKESTAPTGYYSNSREFIFAIDPVSTGNQAPTTIQLNDGQALIDYQGSARFKKVDGRDFSKGKETPLAGARFQLYTADGKTSIGDTVTSNSDGYFTFTNLAPGTTYAIKETQAPDGYLINQQMVRFTTPLSNGEDSSAITIDNVDQKLVVDEKTPFKNYKEGVRFQKLDANGHGLGGAKYQLMMQQSGQWIPVTDSANGAGSDGFFTSDALDGNVRAFELSPGNYKFVEKAAPNGYLLNTKEIPFVVQTQAESDPPVYDIPITGDANVNFKGSAQLYKEAENASDDGFSKQAGATFDVYTDAATPEKVTTDSLKSDTDGNVTITGLGPGNYYFQEVSNSSNYLVNTQKIKFTIPINAAGKPTVVTANDQTAPGGKMTLRNYLGAVELVKVDKDNQPLRAAEFTVYDNDNKAVGTGVSGADGKVTIDKLAPGDYTIKETKAPTGYLINDKILSFTISNSANGQPQTVTIPDNFIDYQGAVKLMKTDSDDRPLAGAKFQLLDSESHPVGETVTANGNGEVVFNNLAPGDYTFKEVAAPSGYLLNTTTVPVTVPKSADGEPAVVTVQDHFVNYQGTAELTKADGDGKALAGAKFKVVDDQGKDVAGKIATSDKDGLVRVTGLAPGSYRFVETEAPNKGNDGKYIMTSDNLAFDIPTESKGQPAVVKLADKVKNYRGMIRLHKVGNDINDDSKTVDLAGAAFSLYKKADFSDADPVKVISNAKGLVEFTDLAPGTYYVKETAAPNGYLLNTFPLTFVIPERVPSTMPMTDGQNHTNKIEDGTYVVDAGDFHNARKEIELKKTDGETSGNLDLSQVVFALYIDDGSTDGKLVKDALKPESDGTIDLSNLALEDGSYKLVETQTAKNYVISSQPIYFVVDNQQVNGMKLDLENYQASIKGRKVTGDQKLAGAEYALFRSNDLNTPIETTDKAGAAQTTIKTDSNGEFYAKGLSAGDYVLKETKAPKGYIRDTTEYKFTIYPQKGEPATVDLGDFENYQGTAKLTKKAESGKLLSDALFEVQTAAAQTVKENLKTDENGEVTIKDLEPGDYQFVETKAPAGYLINTTPVPFTINETSEGKPAVVIASDNFVNYQGSARFRKTDAENKPLKNAKFEVRDDQDEVVGEASYSDQAGYVTATGLAPGSYNFVEVEAPAGYLINTRKIPFTIASKAQGKPSLVEALSGDDFIDYKGSAVLKKADTDGTALEGAVFDVVDANGTKIGETLSSSDEDGKVTVTGLAPGKYSFIEQKAPDGYIINTDPIPFEIPTSAKDEPEQVKANEGKAFINYQGSVQLKKVAFDRSDVDQGLAGATFIVEDADGNQVGDSKITGSDGIVTFNNLKPGTYNLVETEAPEGYLINSAKIPFEISGDASGEPKTVLANHNESFNNYKGTFQMVKESNDGKRLKGAEFDLYKGDSTVPERQGTTDGSGVLTLNGLAPGDYHLKEKVAPNGYIINETQIDFTISGTAEGQPAVVMPKEPFINYQGSAELIKKNADGQPLKGAEFEVLDSERNRVGETITSNKDGEVVAEGLAPGDYVFKEVKAPTGYVINSTEVPFTIKRSTEDGKQTATIKEPLINYQGSAKIIKTNEEGKGLSGAIFKLRTKAGKMIKKDLKTDAEGVVKVDQLSPGDYQFIETKAPAGYIVNTTPVDFTINAKEKGKPKEILASDKFINYQGKVELTKVDADNKNKHLANAEFQLLDSNQKVIRDVLKTNADGKLDVNKLAPGNYVFKETKAPTGYQLSEAQIPFTIVAAQNGKPVQIKVEAKNKKIPNQSPRSNKPTKSGHRFYPKTGEDKGLALLVVGALMILIVIGISYLRKKR
ncbi:SpaA isopeptide-forming pilin-related protein [Enterococcus sp. AZ007]|uniref:SpaA isopeptide-forming pilin-related protein n=1 Tax=Enterococcus sp. AZ007 TaxID=2774839 RepID=UPI003F22C9EA